MAVLDKVITIQEVYNIDKSPKNYHWKVLRGALDNFYDRLGNNFFTEAEEVPPFDYKDKLPEEFIDKNIDDASMKLRKLDKRRKRVLGYVRNDGWKWEDVIFPEKKQDS